MNRKVLAILSGVVLWIATPPVGIWILAWVALSPLILSILRARTKWQAAGLGYLFGWCYLGPLLYWVGNTIVGWTQSDIGWLAWFGLTLVLALFYAVWAAVVHGLEKRYTGIRLVLGMAAAWVVMEWCRTLGPLSMPWAQLSYSQYHFLPVLQISDITGAYGVSFLMLMVNAALAVGWRGRSDDRAWQPLWLGVTLTVLVCLYGAARMMQPNRGITLPVATIQTGISSFNVPTTETQLNIIDTLVQDASKEKPAPALYVFPESGAPGDALHNPVTYLLLQKLAKQTDAGIMIGTSINSKTRSRSTNSVLLFSPRGGLPDRYDKQQLVPFGEFIPFRALIDPVIGHSFDIPPDDDSPGDNPHVLTCSTGLYGKLALGPFICYESMYPQYARFMTRNGATLLVTQSNDSWFRSSAAREQHLSAVVARAIENRRYIVRSTTTGITCIIDPEGRVIAKLPRDVAGYLYRNIQELSGQTIYVRIGDWFLLICLLFTFWNVMPAKFRRKRNTA